MRFDGTIKIQSLTRAFADATIIANVFAAMTKCSGCIDASPCCRRQCSLSDTVEIAKDLNALRTFGTNQKADIKALKAALNT